MKTNPELTAQLKKAEDAAWVTVRAERVQRLPSKTRALWHEMNGRDATGRELGPTREPEDWQERRRRSSEALQAFDELPGEQRRDAFALLFPKVGDLVDETWELLKRSPYQIGYTRQGFRAPAWPSLTRDARGMWLKMIGDLLGRFDQDIIWLAQWAGHITSHFGADAFGGLFATAINRRDTTGEQVFTILKSSADGTHPVGQMGRHVTRALLMCDREDGWEYVEKLLLAAQRQEGLRQSVLEALDEAHPDAYRRILAVTLEHNLERFSSVVRAFDVWLALRWDSAAAGVVRKGLETLHAMLTDAEARAIALRGDDAEKTYIALYAAATEDVAALEGLVPPLLAHKRVEIRFVTAWLLLRAGVVRQLELVAQLYADPDPRIKMLAAAATGNGELSEHIKGVDQFARLAAIFETLPEKNSPAKPLVWPWHQIILSRSAVADRMPANRGQHPWADLLRHTEWMSPHTRQELVRKLADEASPEPAVRAALLALAGDASATVRERALAGLAKMQPTAKEIQELENYLTRQATDLRRGVLQLLLNQNDGAALASAKRLIEAKEMAQTVGGVELLRLLHETGRCANDVLRLAIHTKANSPVLPLEAENHLIALIEGAAPVPTLESGLGLYRPSECSPAVMPSAIGEILVNEESIRLILALDGVVHERRESPVRFQRWGQGPFEEHLLGECTFLPMPDPKLTLEEDAKRLPLVEVWFDWWRQIRATLPDGPEKELVRAASVLRASLSGHRYFQSPEGRVVPGFGWADKGLEKHFIRHEVKLRYPPVLVALFDWLVTHHARDLAHRFYLSAAETTLADLAASGPDAARLVEIFDRLNYNAMHPSVTFLHLAEGHFARRHAAWNDDEKRQLWRLEHWITRPMVERKKGLLRRTTEIESLSPTHIRPPLAILLEAFRLGEAAEADVYDHLIGQRPPSNPRSYFVAGSYWDLAELTRASAIRTHKEHPGALAIVDKIRQRVIDIEAVRGDTATPASALVRNIRSISGVSNFGLILSAVNRTPLQRGFTLDSLSRKSTLSHLLRVCLPMADDTPEIVGPKLRALDVKPARLIEAAMYAPQWARHVEAALGWPGFERGVWWMHAHTKDSKWSVEQEIREQWAGQIAEQTPLSTEDLLNGAVDVAWFRACHEQLGAKRWAALDQACRYTSGGGGHKRAQLFADAMLGKASEKELLQRIRQKRYQDAVRALGLLPLPQDAAREPEILHRYKALQDFVRGSREFGAMRQASEKLAARLGQENLARTAGYRDPMRLQWAMEALAVRDLGAGALSATAGDVVVTLRVDSTGEVELTATKTGKPVKAIPPAAKKNEAVQALVERKASLARQRSTLRKSLEEMMCRRDSFTGAELKQLMQHPLAAPMLSNLVLLNGDVLGYPREVGQLLEDFSGHKEPALNDEQLVIAHSYDLWKSAHWSEWQRECFAHERVQPFKQVFRELYPMTDAERHDPDRTRRFAGQQVNPKQALALLGQRGWVTRPEEGVGKTFHHQDVTAWLTFEEAFYTPAEIEGLTLEGVAFTQRTKTDSISLERIDPVMFSEVMRDVDLIVSVAHRGGVDPEASASTIEMRTSLARETAQVLQLDNVRFKDRHVVIEGQHATYTVHLGSGVAHLLPGGMLFLVAVHAQHRGRLFLPFADDDPKTAEILSKILLLARDSEIKDPNLLDQIRLRR